ncbi:glycine oxidase ThiO, partial [Microbacteriaceae bacterium K1510]|nr:glycine oxidase ThiO [Microbacteriaceae bacterium K1510]
GGGIIGLSLAYELSKRGKAVTIIEQGEWGGQASSAAAGMLAPLKEFSKPGLMLDLGIASLECYPQWAEELEEATGVHVQLSLDGLITVAMNQAEAMALRTKFEWQHAAGYDVKWLEREQLLELEPLLSPHVEGGIFSPGEGHINNRMLLQALVAACTLQGVEMLPGTVVTQLLTGAEQRVAGVMTTAGSRHAKHTVVAAGAWAGIIAQLLGVSLPIRPVRGQVAAVASGGIPLRRVIFGTTGYLAPKKDGRIVIGATEDEAGFCREVTLAGLANVCNGVLPYVPSLHNAPFLQAWAGLRPATEDGMPLFGPVPGWSGISMATGHFRNGILLSPITAKRMTDWLI